MTPRFHIIPERDDSRATPELVSCPLPARVIPFPDRYERLIAKARNSGGSLHSPIERSRYAGPLIAAWSLIAWAVMLGCVFLIVSGRL